MTALKASVAEQELQKKELHALRDYVYSLHQQAATETFQGESVTLKDTLPTMVEAIQQEKVVIIGGHQDIHSQLKLQLGGYKYVHLDNLNADISFIKNCEYAFINTAYLSHALYEKVMKQIGKGNVKVCYLSDRTNTDLIVREIYETIQRFK